MEAVPNVPLEDVARVARIDAVPSILEVVCRATGMGFAAVVRVTEDRWIVCAVRDEIAFGLVPGGELKVETTICDEIRDSGQAVVIDHVAEDESFCAHPTPAMYGFQSYISMPIFRADKSFIGTLCSIDPHPAKVSRPEIVNMFRLFAELIALHLDAQDRMDASETALASERDGALLREQFIDVLGHDLRNPLASTGADVHMLQREKQTEKALTLLGLIDNNVARMGELINNVLDFARARQGVGLAGNRSLSALAPALQQVIDEARSAAPNRKIVADVDIAELIDCDAARIGQLASSLIGNALTHGAKDGAVRVSAATNANQFILSVANEGDPIAPDAMERLFQPFVRGAGQSRQGLGLGLYIASEIARAHGGVLGVTSTPDETCFTFVMPLS